MREEIPLTGSLKKLKITESNCFPFFLVFSSKLISRFRQIQNAPLPIAPFSISSSNLG